MNVMFWVVFLIVLLLHFLEGIALIIANEALLWTDGQYFLQATQQHSHQWKMMRIGEDPLLENWISDVCTPLIFKLLTSFIRQNLIVGLQDWLELESTLSTALRRLYKSLDLIFVCDKILCFV